MVAYCITTDVSTASVCVDKIVEGMMLYNTEGGLKGIDLGKCLFP